MATSLLPPSASSSVSTTLIPSPRQSLVSSNTPSYHTINSASPADVVNLPAAAPNDLDLITRAADADNYQRQSNRIFLIACLMFGGTNFIKWLKDEPGFPPLYALCAVSIPITLVFSGFMFRMCACFAREEIAEARPRSREEREVRQIEVIIEDSESEFA